MRELGEVVVADGFTQSPRDSPIATTTPITSITSTSALITDSTITVKAR